MRALLTQSIVDDPIPAQRGSLTTELCDEALASLGDAVVAQLLVAKNDADTVPMAVWWLVADSLRSSAVASRAAGWTESDAASATEGNLLLLVDRAIAACELAASKLAERCALEPSPEIASRAVDDASAVAEVRRTDLRLARLLVSEAPTPPTLLLVRIEALATALSDWRRLASQSLPR